MNQSVESQAEGSPAPPDADRSDAQTLHTRCADWRDSLFRIHACSHRRVRVLEHEDHLDWGAIRPTAHLRLLLRGSIRLHTEGTRVDVGRGAAMSLLLPSQGLRLEVTGLPLEYLYLQFSGEPALRCVEELQAEVGILQQLSPTGRCARGMRKIIREVAADPVRDALHWSRRGHDVLTAWWEESLAARAAQRRARTGGKPLPPGVEARAATLPAPAASPLFKAPPRSVKEFAARLGYSRSHLSTTLSEAWRETPAAVLRRDRMERARELLRRGRSVTEVAADAGYAGHQSFGRAYRKHFGWLPSQENLRAAGEDPAPRTATDSG